MSDGICWGYAESRDVERYQGQFATRQEAIDAGREAYEGQRETFIVLAGRQPKASSFVLTGLADQIGDSMFENAEDQVGDVAEDFPEITTEASAALDKLLATWADEHISVHFWVAESDTMEEIPVKVPEDA